MELADGITEAQKCHSLLSASWRLRTIGPVILSKTKDLRPKGANGVNPSQGTGKGEI
jgi:hypothetical protein